MKAYKRSCNEVKTGTALHSTSDTPGGPLPPVQGLPGNLHVRHFLTRGSSYLLLLFYFFLNIFPLVKIMLVAPGDL